MAEQILNTRIQLKYDSYKNWVEKNPTLLAGEVAIAYLPPRADIEHTNPAPAAVATATLMKVGPGAFNSLPWLSATAADVYTWAKQENLPLVRNDGDKAAGNVISSITWEDNSIKYTTASVATSEGMEALQESVQGILDDIAANREDWAEKTVDTNTDTQYRFTTDGDKLVVYKTLYTLGVAGTEEKVGEYEFLTEGEVRTILADYYTKNEINTLISNYYTKGEINTLTDGKLHTQSQIEGYIDTALANISDADAIEGITTLVEYVNTHGADLAAITKEIYGDSGKVGDDPSRIDTAVSNASEALETANTASGVASGAAGVANEAKGLASEAKEAALTAQNSASASAQAAAASAGEASSSAQQAAASAGEASGFADAASGSASAADEAKQDAETAKADAVNAQGAAESARDLALGAKDAAVAAQGLAEGARDAAVAAQGKAEKAQEDAETARANAVIAQEAAEAAQAQANDAATAASGFLSRAEDAKRLAEAARDAALDSNTSATAIANAAKAEAEAATEASTAATQAVAGLHKIATSGSAYDLAEVGTAKNSSNQDVPCLIFYCGTASELV